MPNYLVLREHWQPTNVIVLNAKSKRHALSAANKQFIRDKAIVYMLKKNALSVLGLSSNVLQKIAVDGKDLKLEPKVKSKIKDQGGDYYV